MLPFSLKQLVTSLFTQVNNNIFAVLLGRLYGMQPTGYYTQGNKWTVMGYSTLVGMINSVGQPVFRETIDDIERLRRVFRKLLRFAAFISFPAMFGLAIVSQELITLAITDKWLDAVSVMQVLCIGGAFMPLGVLYGNLFNSLGKPGIYMWNTITLGLTQIACVVVSCRYGMNVMLIVYTAVNILWIFVWQYFAHKHIGLRLIDVLKDILPYLMITIVVMTAAMFVASYTEGLLLSLFVKIVVAATLYILLLYQFNSVVFSECINYLLKRKR